MSYLRVLSVASLCVSVADGSMAQSAAGRTSGVGAIDSFLRVASLIGSSSADLARIWPAKRGPQQFELHITPADRLSVRFADMQGAAATGVAPISGVRLSTSVPDSLALARSVTAIAQRLTERFGAPSRCSDPLGAPSHLYAPQEVTRVWQKGPGGVPLSMTWSVSRDGVYGIALNASATVDEYAATLACDAKMP